MAFIHKSGKALVEWWPKVASTTIPVGTALTFDGSGAVSVAASTSLPIAGICLKPIASTDADYASNTLIPVLIPSQDSVFEVDVENSGTATAANVGVKYDLNSTTGTGINLSGTSHKQVTVVSFISATKVWVKINGAYQFVNAV